MAQHVLAARVMTANITSGDLLASSGKGPALPEPASRGTTAPPATVPRLAPAPSTPPRRPPDLGGHRKRQMRVSALLDRVCDTAHDDAPRHDSVVVVGGDDLATAGFVARLAREPQFADRLTVIRRVSDRAQPRAGVVVSGATMDLLSYAVATDREHLEERLSPGGIAAAYDERLVTEPGVAGSIIPRAGRLGESSDPAITPVRYGLGAYHAASVIAGFIDAEIETRSLEPGGDLDLESLRSVARGASPMVVDLGSAVAPPACVTAAAVGWSVLAVEMPVASGGTVDLASLAHHGSVVAVRPRRGGTDLAYLTPFADPATPTASRLVSVRRLVRDDRAVPRAELTDLVELASRFAAAFDHHPVDVKQTRCASATRIGAIRPDPSSDPVGDIVDLSVFRRASSAGTDVGSGQVAAAVIAAESIARGGDPLGSAARAIAPRRFDRLRRHGAVRTPNAIATRATRRAAFALGWPHALDRTAGL